jgi:hypothetical protein
LKLFGRLEVQRQLETLFENARQGRSGTLVLTGEPGIGKTALLREVVAACEGFEAVQVAGVESEMELPYAALHRLLLPFLARLSELPPPQREAIEAAFGLQSAHEPVPFLVALGALTLLSDVSVVQPIFCAIDDVQWVDSESLAALGFVARRLLAEKIVMLFCVRQPAETAAYLNLIPELKLTSLDQADAHQVLVSAAGRVDHLVAQRLIAAAGGNPLAIIEFAHQLTQSQLAGEELLPEPLPLSRQLEEHFLRRMRSMSPAAQTVLLVAACDSSGEPDLIERAADHLGIQLGALPVGEMREFLTLRPQVLFRHPLIRSAVYGGATPDLRQMAHAALASATDSEQDPDRRAWHLASATLERDENVAVELERSAARARSRGGYVSESLFFCHGQPN